MFDQSRLLGTEQTKAQSVGGTLRRLWSYFRRYWLALIVVAVLIVAGTYMQVLIPDLTGQAADCYLGPFAASAAVATGEGGAIPGDLQTLPGVDVANNAFSNCWYTTPNLSATAAATLAGVTQLILLIVALYVGNAIVGGVQFYLMSRAGYYVLRDLRAEVFQHVHRLSLGYFSKREVGSNEPLH